MPKPRVTISKIRHTLQRLHSGNLGQRQIGAALGISKSTVSEIGSYTRAADPAYASTTAVTPHVRPPLAPRCWCDCLSVVSKSVTCAASSCCAPTPEWTGPAAWCVQWQSGFSTPSAPSANGGHGFPVATDASRSFIYIIMLAACPEKQSSIFICEACFVIVISRNVK